MMDELFLNWVNTLPAATLVVAVAWAAMRLIKNIESATRHAIWWAVLATVVALPVIPVASEAIQASMAEEATVNEPAASTAPAEVPLAAVARTAAAPAWTVTTAPPEPEAAKQLELGKGIWLNLLAGTWAVLAFVQLLRVTGSYVALRALKLAARPAPRAVKLEADEWALAMGLHRDFRLLVSDDIESPVAVGFRHPAVILPAALLPELKNDDLSHVLLHELAHLARRDDWTNLLLRVLGGALALHPLAHVVSRQIDREREIACDDWVVAATGQAKPYAVSLARLVELDAVETAPLLATGMAVRTSEVGDRIERLLQGVGPCSGRTSLQHLALSGTALIGLLLASSGLPQFAVWAQEKPAPAAPPAAASTAPKKSAPAATAAPAGTPVAAKPAKAGPKVVVAQQAPVVVAAEPATPGTQREGYLAMLQKAGYSDLPVDEIIELKIHGVDGRYIAAMNQAGFGRLSTKELIELRIQGVTEEHAREAKKFKPNATVRQVIQMKIAGVL